MDKSIRDFLVNGKIGTTELAEVTGDSRGLVRAIFGRVMSALNIELMDILSTRIKDDGDSEVEVYLDEDLLNCYLALAPVYKKYRAIKAEKYEKEWPKIIINKTLDKSN
jgi:hypothetical protein